MSLQPPSGPEHLLGADKIEAPVTLRNVPGLLSCRTGVGGDWRGTGHDIGTLSRLVM
jgi:hypothetical protein